MKDVLLKDLPSNFKRFVEVGRVVLLKEGAYSGKIAIIAEILDQNRAMIDGPTSGVPRQPYSYKNMVLTPLKVTGLPRVRPAVVRKVAEKEAVVEKWNKTGWAQKRAAIEKRRSLNDFARFNVMLAKKQRRDAVRKTVRKLAQEQA
ncbi:putative 60S ribosomal protein L14 [Lyophyllum shimeji]|uniref:60S ribosomal protein L14 n=1 Tax=Lyophyllum shimeji TaxID=47721 RepID=A0A9P3PYT6_LYOSH|nr:putative 60S ribosomal protein L14 [Lyophyllum shimeji]